MINHEKQLQLGQTMFWFGVLICVAGVGEHIVEFIDTASSQFRMVGLPITGSRWAAMAAITLGMVIATFGLLTESSEHKHFVGDEAGVGSKARARTILVLCFALLIDQMKPTSLAFIVPGMQAEYHLTKAEVSILPVVALTCNVIGALVWGYFADRIGRRAAIIIAALLFVGTSINAAQTEFAWNLVVTIPMGMSAGGMLPIVYALMSELLPRRNRGMIVLQAGLTAALAYVLVSAIATFLVPLVGWRILWFAQLPAPLILILINRWIPESRAFQTAKARRNEFGAAAEPSVGILVQSPHLPQTLTMSAFAVSAGFVFWGFMTFVPTILAESHLGVPAAQLLFIASLLSLPGIVLAAWLFGHWSANWTMALFAGVTVIALALFMIVPVDGNPVLLIVMILALLTGTNAVFAMIGPYTAHVYPAECRGAGSGLVAACGKSGGLFGPPFVAVLLGAFPLGAVAAVVTAPLAVAGVAIAIWGRKLE